MIRHEDNMSRRAMIFSGALLTALAVAFFGACGGSSEQQLAKVAPISDILDGEILVVDITATSAGVRVDTAEGVVCSVVYGTDETYGLQSTDLDMAGLPHMNHAAPMRGLEPDTVYHYRVQGTGSNGTLYVSEDRTFRTEAGDPAAADKGANLASMEAGASVIEASSFFGDSPTWRPENAIDGDGSTEWSSAGDGDAAFITVQLADEAQIDELGVWTRTMGTSAQIETIRVVTDRGEVLGPFTLPDASGLFLFPVDASASTLRFEIVSSSGGNTGLVEIAVYGRVVGN